MMRIPVGPLEEWFAVNYPPVDVSCAWHERVNDRPSANRMADVLDRHEHTVRAWRRHGMTLHAADEASITLGTHPTLIWDDWELLEDWRIPPWFRERRRNAVRHSWRLRADCTGTAGDHARQLLDIDTGDTAA